MKRSALQLHWVSCVRTGRQTATDLDTLLVITWHWWLVSTSPWSYSFTEWSSPNQHKTSNGECTYGPSCTCTPVFKELRWLLQHTQREITLLPSFDKQKEKVCKSNTDIMQIALIENTNTALDWFACKRRKWVLSEKKTWGMRIKISLYCPVSKTC